MSLSDDIAGLAETLEAEAGEPVTYTRGTDGATTAVAAAVRERATHERFALADGRVELEEVPQDWAIRPALIAFGGVPHTPTRGDQITDAAGNVYEVTPRSQEPARRRADAYGHLWRLRTVLVSGGA